MTLEMQIIYEAFTLLVTTKVIPDRKSFASNFIASIKPKITVQLWRKVLEWSINDTPSTSRNEILASLQE